MAEFSDAYLRTELAKFGVKCGPITASTKDVYVRKLLKLRCEKPGTEKRSLQGFSSDESDSENHHVNRLTATANSKNLRHRKSGVEILPKSKEVSREINNSSNNIGGSSRRSLGLSLTDGKHPMTRRQRALADKSFTLHNKSEFSSSDYDTDEDLRIEFKKDKYSHPVNGRSSITFKPSSEGLLSQQPRTSTPAKSDNSFVQGDWTRKQPSTRENDINSNHFRMTDSFPTTSNKSQWISMILVGMVLFFFFTLGLIYLGLLPNEAADTSTLPSSSSLTKNSSDQRHAKIVAMSQNIVTLLQERAGQHECSLSNNPPSRNMSKQQLQIMLIKDRSGDKLYWQEALSLLLNNPNLGVWLLDKFGENVTSPEYLDKVSWLEAEKAWKPLWCRLHQAVRKVIYQILILIAVLLLIGGSTSAFAWSWMNRKEERQKVLFMVQRVLDVLENNESACGEDSEKYKPYLAIPHVRDQLISPADRSAMQKIWDKAVKFLEDNESRVRTECQEIEGENYQVWRWLPKNTEAGKNKSRWQGEAFSQSSQGGTHAAGPSSCLKIRNMFDLDDNFGDKWKESVEEAIMEKCRDMKAVLHIHIPVDETANEGCVYLKCKNQEAAAQVYKKLHGSWYDGKLVTVKYIRDERYYQRCPDAIGATKPL